MTYSKDELKKRSDEIVKTRKMCIMMGCYKFAAIGSHFCDNHRPKSGKIKCQK